MRWLVCCMILFAGCLNTGSSDDAIAPGPFSMVGTNCTELLIEVTIDGVHAQQQLPEGYTALQLNGQGFAIVGLKECGDVQIDGASIGAASTGDIGILLETMSPTFRYYQTQWYTDNLVLQQRLTAQGWNAPWSPADAIGDGRMAGVGAMSFTIPVSEGLVRAEATVIGQEIPGSLNAIGWFEGPLGPVKVEKTLNNTATSIGQGSVTANGAVAAMLGTSFIEGTATAASYSMTGTVG